MLNDKKGENGFLDALNNIDDDLVEEVTEMSVRPSIIKSIPKKSSFMRIVASAASLAVVAAVGIGALIIMKNLPSSPLTEQTSDNTSKSTVSEETDISTEQSVQSTADTTAPDSSADKYSNADEILSQSDWQYINYYFDATNDNYGINNFDNLNPEDADTQTGMVVAAVFDRKTFGGGEYEIALLGFKVWTDNARFAEGTVLAREMRIALVKSQSNKIIAAAPVYDPLNPDAAAYQLDKDYFDKYTQIAEFDENRNIVIFRSLYNCRIPEVLFFFIDGDTMRLCEREELPSDSKREDRSEVLSSVISKYMAAHDYSIDENPLAYTVKDELTETVYTFRLPEATYVKGTELYTQGIDMFKPLDLDSIPLIEEFYYDDIENIIGTLARDMLICEKTVGEYTLSLVGQNFRKSEIGVVYFYNPQTWITKDGENLGSISNAFPVMIPYKSAMVYSNNGDYSGYGMEAYMFGDTLLMFDNVLSIGDYEEEKFYAVKDGSIYTLNGNYDGVTGSDPPKWTEGEKGYDLIVDTENQTVIYGFRQYKFELDNVSNNVSDSEYSYTVSWLDKPVE